MHHVIISAKCCNHHQQSGFRHMEVGDHRIRNTEFIRRENEFVCPAVKWFQFSLRWHGSFNSTHYSSSNSTIFLLSSLRFVHNLTTFFSVWSPVQNPFCVWWDLPLLPDGMFRVRRCKVNSAKWTPFSSSLLQEVLKCKPAVGAATALSWRQTQFGIFPHHPVPLYAWCISAKECFPVEWWLFKFFVGPSKRNLNVRPWSGIVNDFRDKQIIFSKIQFVSDTNFTGRSTSTSHKTTFTVQFMKQNTSIFAPVFFFISIQTGRKHTCIIYSHHIPFIKISENVFEMFCVQFFKSFCPKPSGVHLHDFSPGVSQ